jgi:hypothetical protein
LTPSLTTRLIQKILQNIIFLSWFIVLIKVLQEWLKFDYVCINLTNKTSGQIIWDGGSMYTAPLHHFFDWNYGGRFVAKKNYGGRWGWTPWVARGKKLHCIESDDLLAGSELKCSRSNVQKGSEPWSDKDADLLGQPILIRARRWRRCQAMWTPIAQTGIHGRMYYMPAYEEVCSWISSPARQPVSPRTRFRSCCLCGCQCLSTLIAHLWHLTNPR